MLILKLLISVWNLSLGYKLHTTDNIYDANKQATLSSVITDQT